MLCEQSISLNSTFRIPQLIEKIVYQNHKGILFIYTAISGKIF